MTRSDRRRRLLTAFAAGVTATALVAGCGGSSVTPESDPGANPVTQAETSTGVDGGVAAGDGTTAVPGVPTTGDASTAAGTGPGTSGATAKPGSAGNSTEDGNSTGTGRPAKGTAAMAPVQAMIANSPIFGGKAPCKPATLSEVNIGNLSSLSGVLGELFAPLTPALNTFVASQNACGGLNGHKIKLFQSDDQGDPSTAQAIAQRMIQVNKVIAFVGNIQVLTIDGVLPVYKKYNIPVIGADDTNNTWFSNDILFPSGPGPQSISYGYLVGAQQYHKKNKVGNIWCIEVPRGCGQIDQAFKELAPKLGATMAKSLQASITSPSYVQECLQFKNSGVEVLALTFDAASNNRLARSCTQVGWSPKLVAYPLSVGNEKQFLQGNKWLGDTYVPMNHFPWMDGSTPATAYYQAAVKRYNPGFTTGGAASLGWAAGALLVAASAGLSETSPTSQQLMDTLYTFKGESHTTLGGLTAPLSFTKGGRPHIPYCLFGAISNDDNTGWKQVVSKPTCTKITAPSDPQNAG